MRFIPIDDIFSLWANYKPQDGVLKGALDHLKLSHPLSVDLLCLLSWYDPTSIALQEIPIEKNSELYSAI